jgi:hypothetical protein
VGDKREKIRRKGKMGQERDRGSGGRRKGGGDKWEYSRRKGKMGRKKIGGVEGGGKGDGDKWEYIVGEREKWDEKNRWRGEEERRGGIREYSRRKGKMGWDKRV